MEDDFGQQVVCASTIPPPAAPSQVEVVSSVFEAQTTLNEADKQILLQAAYGDLLPHLRETQREREQRLFKGEKISEVYSEALPHPDRCLIIGLNGKGQALAIVAVDNDEKQQAYDEYLESLKSETQLSPAQLMERIVKYASVNACFNLKRHLMEWERLCYTMCLEGELRDIKTEEQAKAMLSAVMAIAKMDPRLRPPIKSISAKLTHLLKGEQVQHKAAEELIEPEISFTITSYSNDNLEYPTWEETDPSNVKYRLLMCKPPTVNMRRCPGWKDIDIGISTANNMLPACAFNDTHILVVYSPPKEGPEVETLFADLYLIESRKRVDRFFVNFPKEGRTRTRGFVTLSLSPMGVAALTFCNMAYVFDTSRTIEEPRLITINKSPEDTTPPPSFTCARVFHPLGIEDKTKPAWEGTLLLGTSRGEVLSIKWIDGINLFIDHTHQREPVLSVYTSNGRVVLQTINHIWLMPTLYKEFLPRTVVSAGRPLAIGSVGTLLTVLSKYGTLNLYSVVQAGAVRVFEPPPMQCKTSMFQVAYDGIKTTHNSITVVYPDGRIRGIYY